MAIDKRVATAAAAMIGVKDGATVFVSGFGGAGFPNVLLQALLELGPKELTLVANSATHRYSITHELIAAGMVRHVICSAARGHDKSGLSAFEELYKVGKIGLTLLPQGTFSEAIRAGGAGIPAFFTPVGYGTDLAKGKETREIKGRNYVLEEAISGDLALIRADMSDRYGNLHFRQAQANFGPVMATAAKLTVAEVRATIDAPMAQSDITLPGVYVDRVVAVGSGT
ncbi:MAG: 3-oxoacid CoA-transferase subunit A [Acetobacteraceae bacterium]|nr:3-oxoacid CoA-transferase subunit A [Acetobacteraceae bacterium]